MFLWNYEEDFIVFWNILVEQNLKDFYFEIKYIVREIEFRVGKVFV